MKIVFTTKEPVKVKGFTLPPGHYQACPSCDGKFPIREACARCGGIGLQWGKEL